jgi:hypothetical protein
MMGNLDYDLGESYYSITGIGVVGDGGRKRAAVLITQSEFGEDLKIGAISFVSA